MCDFYLLLREVDGPVSESIDLAKLRAKDRSFTDEQLWTRVLLLTQQLGVPEGSELHVADEFADLLHDLGQKTAIPRARLAAAIRNAQRVRQSDSDPLVRYQERLWRHLSRSFTGTLRDPDYEAFHEGPAPAVRWLTPLLQTWPSNILNSPSWNRIESPSQESRTFRSRRRGSTSPYVRSRVEARAAERFEKTGLA